jgi:hypothetical protein
LGTRELEVIFYRVMQKHGAYLDPFTVMEVVTLLKPIAGIPLNKIMSDEGLSLKLRSVVDYIDYILKRLGFDNHENIAKSMVEEVIEECQRTCPKG